MKDPSKQLGDETFDSVSTFLHHASWLLSMRILYFMYILLASKPQHFVVVLKEKKVKLTFQLLRFLRK